MRGRRWEESVLQTCSVDWQWGAVLRKTIPDMNNVNWSTAEVGSLLWSKLIYGGKLFNSSSCQAPALVPLYSAYLCVSVCVLVCFSVCCYYCFFSDCRIYLFSSLAARVFNKLTYLLTMIKSAQWHEIINSLTPAPLVVSPLTKVHSFYVLFFIDVWILVRMVWRQCKWYGNGAGNTVEENSSIFSLIRMR